MRGRACSKVVPVGQDQGGAMDRHDALFNPFGAGTDASRLTTEQARQLAVTMGTTHRRAMEALQDVATTHGGGLSGLLRGLIEEYLGRGIISSNDADRLRRLVELLAYQDAETATAIQALYDEAVVDTGSSLPSLAALSVALDNAMLLRTVNADPDPTSVFAGGADVIGTLAGFGLGGIGGLPGMVVGGYLAGTAASHAVLAAGGEA
jgi:hypothetical protein